MANEKRLISAEQAYEIARLHHHDFAQSLADLTSLREVLEDCDTVDAVEVVHGRWAHLGGDEWCCTACGEVVHTEGSWEKPDKKYCYECGAKMDGGNEDGC